MPERQKELFTIKIDWETCSDVTKKNSKLLTTSDILGYSQTTLSKVLQQGKHNHHLHAKR